MMTSARVRITRGLSRVINTAGVALYALWFNASWIIPRYIVPGLRRPIPALNERQYYPGDLYFTFTTFKAGLALFRALVRRAVFCDFEGVLWNLIIFCVSPFASEAKLDCFYARVINFASLV